MEVNLLTKLVLELKAGVFPLAQLSGSERSLRETMGIKKNFRIWLKAMTHSFMLILFAVAMRKHVNCWTMYRCFDVIIFAYTYILSVDWQIKTAYKLVWSYELLHFNLLPK